MTNDKFKPIQNVPKTYEQFVLEEQNLNQQNLYPDLVHEDISEQRGYGPCNWSNSYCSCWSGERWVYLHIACPVAGCRRNDDDTSDWTHVADGYRVQMSNKARIQCTKSGGCDYPSHVRHWKFICSDHDGTPKSTDETSYIEAVLIANKLKRLDRSLAVELVNYLTANDWTDN